MVTVHKNIVPENLITELLDYLNLVDGDSDVRPGISTKIPQWNVGTWPQQCVASILNMVLDKPYQVEHSMFFGHELYINIHNHSGLGADLQPLYRGTLIPLEVPENDVCGTVFFNNYWHGPGAKFSKAPAYQYGFDLTDKFGNTQFIKDIRTFKSQLLNSSVSNFDATKELLDKLDYLISWVPTGRNMPVSDYSNIINLVDQPFPEDLRLKYCNHHSPEDVYGLSLDQYVQWQVGDVIEFDRTQLHCTASQGKGKKAIVVFTNLDTA
jgi:hypothetical protein